MAPNNLSFPHFTILRASAGSGKTYNLSNRFAQFLLSKDIKYNSLNNILAITFSNNAAKEMKMRILDLLRAACLRNQESLSRLMPLFSMSIDEIAERACKTVDVILENYSDFQVKTIDSFMAGLFKSSAIEFGYHPSFDILLSIDNLMDYGFSLFMRKIPDNPYLSNLVEQSINLIQDNRGEDSTYLWDPSKDLLKEMKSLYQRLTAEGKSPLLLQDPRPMKDIEAKVKITAKEFVEAVERHKLKTLQGFDRLVKGRMEDIIQQGSKRCPLSKENEKKSPEPYVEACKKWDLLKDLLSEYMELKSLYHYQPYLHIFSLFRTEVEEVKRQQGLLFIGDIGKSLSGYISENIVPDIYFRIGEKIHHFMVDEFQDTSKVQWINLLPLIENALAGYGSFLAVGDTKQSIYRFRNSDYRIMRDLEEADSFLNLKPQRIDLDTNYRSDGAIVRFNERIFKENLRSQKMERCLEAAKRSGLYDYEQRARKERISKGYAELIITDKDEQSDSDKERDIILEIITDLKRRGYEYSDIAILTQTNKRVVEVSGWLNTFDNIPFVSLSSLDSRKRPLVGSIFSILRFLDSPADNLAFASFIRSELFRKNSSINIKEIDALIGSHIHSPFIYKVFQDSYPEDWLMLFKELFTAAGYLPLYDLLTKLYAQFRVFEHFPEEEAALFKLLEVVVSSEQEGFNDIRAFINAANQDNEDSSDWDMPVPQSVDAVSVMTIHKSKGLGFPVVIALLYNEQSKGFPYIMEDRPDSPDLKMYKITKKHCEYNEKLKRLYEEEYSEWLADRLNSLYVCLTRAERELYVIHPRGKKGGIISDLFGEGIAIGEKQLRSGDKKPASSAAYLRHRINPLKIEHTPARALQTENTRRGDFIHKALSFVQFLGDDPDNELRAALRKAYLGGCQTINYQEDEIVWIIKSALQREGIGEYFRNAGKYRVFNEQDYCDKYGRLLRMDRVLISQEDIVIIDYKTGNESTEGHISQIKNYMRLLGEIYPHKTVEGILLYIDLQKIERFKWD